MGIDAGFEFIHTDYSQARTDVGPVTFAMQDVVERQIGVFGAGGKSRS